jgi:pSer/pThr/pTyr-binding forkhead associated (FHA) protein
MIDASLPVADIPVVADSAPRLHLVVQKGPLTGSRIDCRRVVTLLGSRPGCKVLLQHRRVAPVHTVLVNDGAEIKVVDLVTTVGTKLNELNVQLERATDGDTLTIDQWEFRVQIEDAPQNGDADAHPFALEPTPHKVALEHLETGKVLQPNRDVCVIGRRNGCDIVLQDSSVSRAHALLVTYFGYPAVVDLLTSTGTRVNDEPVRFRALRDGDVITVGEARFRVRLVGSKVAEQASTNHKDNGAVRLAAEPVSADLINIEQVDSAQRWRVAESLEKLEKTARKG